MFGDVDGGTAVFAAERQALQQPQADQRDGCGHADCILVRQQADDESRQAHHQDADQKRIFAPDDVAQATEYQRAERPHDKAGSKCEQREDEA